MPVCNNQWAAATHPAITARTQTFEAACCTGPQNIEVSSHVTCKQLSDLPCSTLVTAVLMQRFSRTGNVAQMRI